MADTVETLTARRVAIVKARDSGVLTIRHGDEQTTFRSLAEMNKIVANLDAQIAALQGTQKKRVRYAYQSGKGL
ncbi:UNVERIFIED_ORG: superfamily I DNA and RNA helicase [Rhizobium esperanzae]